MLIPISFDTQVAADCMTSMTLEQWNVTYITDSILQGDFPGECQYFPAAMQR